MQQPVSKVVLLYGGHQVR